MIRATSLIRKAARLLDPPAEPPPRRRSHRPGTAVVTARRAAMREHVCQLPPGGNPGRDKAVWYCPGCLRRWVWTPAGGWR